MIFSKHRRKINADKRFKTKVFQSKVKQAQNYKRIIPISLNPKSRWMVLFGFRSRLIQIAWAGGIGVFAYFFIFSGYLKISAIEISGHDRVSGEQVQMVLDSLNSKRTALIPNSNFFLLTRGRFNQTLTQAVPMIKEVKSYKRVWPNKIVVELTERNPGFVMRSNNQDYLVDEEGVVVRSDATGLNLPLVVDQVIENFDVGEPLPNTRMVTFILSTHKQWDSKISSPITETKIPGKASNEVQFVTQEGWTVFFDTERAVTSQLGNLALILSKQIKASERSNLAYIDLRLSKWAYFCFKNTPCVAGAQEPPVEVTPDVELTPQPPPPATQTNAPKNP
jgi:cell division septal protein FtsQ